MAQAAGDFRRELAGVGLRWRECKVWQDGESELNHFQGRLIRTCGAQRFAILFVVPTNWFASGELLPALDELVSSHDVMSRLWKRMN